METNEWIILLIGIAIPIIIQNFVFPFLPKSITGFASFQKKKIMKKLRQAEIRSELVAKTASSTTNQTLDEVMKMIQKKLSNDFDVNSDGYKLEVHMPIGNNKIKISVIPMSEIVDDIEKFESLECRFSASCRFSKFNNCVRDYREAQRKIENTFREIDIPHFKENISLICKLKSLHEITGVLDSTKFELMSAELGDGKQFELTKNEIIIYDKDVNDEMISLVEKMIIVYD